MASDYVAKLGQYLAGGDFADLTVVCGEKIWSTNKVLACAQFKWFHNALTGDFAEKDSNTIHLHDDPQFVHAIGCMISYFNAAGPPEPKFTTLKRACHAEVAIIADKYVCEGLYKLAKSCLERVVTPSTVEDWKSAVSLVYQFTTPESSAHRDLRSSLIKSLARDNHRLTSIIKDKSMQELLHSNAELATDLLTASCEGWTGVLRVCTACSFTHIGSDVCSTWSANGHFACPRCNSEDDVIDEITMKYLKACPCCEGKSNMH